VMTKRGLYDVPPVTNTPVPGVPSVLPVPGVLGDFGQEWDGGGQEGCPHRTDDEHGENVSIGQVGQDGHHCTSAPVHDLDPDLAERCDVVDVTLIEDEPPDDLRLPPHAPTADLSPAAQAAGVSRRVQEIADTVRPTTAGPLLSAAPPIDEAHPEARGEPVGVDTPRAAPAKRSRQKAAGPHEAPWLFGQWTVTSAPPRHEPPRDEFFADATSQHRAHADDYEEDII
jgi:hypothetical protein